MKRLNIGDLLSEGFRYTTTPKAIARVIALESYIHYHF